MDPNPLVLVLYCDDKICHCLNFHYLPGQLSDQLINMIAQISIKKLKPKSMYSHYHGWMKNHIPSVIRKAYRTYKPNQITGEKKITSGFWGIKTFLNEIQNKNTHKKLSTIQKRLSEKVNKKKVVKLGKAKPIDVETLEKNIDNYLSQIDAIVKKGRKEDMSKYTKI